MPHEENKKLSLILNNLLKYYSRKPSRLVFNIVIFDALVMYCTPLLTNANEGSPITHLFHFLFR